jgi:diguanylate cyclase (GGDEF)-like protein
MPTVNGIDLCREIRQDVNQGDLPIVVVTAHTDRMAVAKIFDAGADDLVAKPILGPELVSRVMIYTERATLRRQVRDLHQQQTRQWQHQLFLHTLTQIGVWDFFWECLQREWYLSQQQKTPLSLMLCGIDSEGELPNAPDRQPPIDPLSWQTLGSALQECLKPSDVVAHYQEGKFAILLPNTALRDTLPIAERIQQAIANLKLPYQEAATDEYVTVSLGITGTIPTNTHSAGDLIETSEQALVNAQKRGRNASCVYPL